MNSWLTLSSYRVLQSKTCKTCGRLSAVLSAREMLTILTVNPSLESHARVKLLEQPAPTQYRLRVGKVRVFYDIRDENSVWVERILYEKEAHVYGRITDEDAQ